ncbi:hypothetical protein [Dyadobacter sp. 3J3]|uniref:hypothetical protein n=1 Tax=Dyadobacter sp. 3J3 TaxID=2606600 RepID=UPI00135ACFB1|nr:hypothetical protein [Dyadobacter sp. 3J3]
MTTRPLPGSYLHFLSSFRFLGDRTIINPQFVKNEVFRKIGIEEFESTYEATSRIMLLQPGTKFMGCVLELQAVLYQLPDEARRVTYVKSIIRDLASKTLKYFNYQYDSESYRTIENEIAPTEYQNKGGKEATEIINKYTKGEELSTKYESYVVLCLNLRQQFLWQLDALCLEFEIDLESIQKEIRIQIQKRDWSVLSYYGHDKPMMKKVPGAQTKLESYFRTNAKELIAFVKEQYESEHLNKPAKSTPLILALNPYLTFDLFQKGDKIKFISALSKEIAPNQSNPFGTVQGIGKVIDDMNTGKTDIRVEQFLIKIKSYLPGI